LGSDLHAPLGQGRLPRKHRPRRALAKPALAILALCAILGLSFYAMQQDDGLKRIASANDDAARADASGAPDQPPAGRTPGASAARNSGANIERLQTADGSTVTKYTPRDREGAQVIDAQRIGQDPRVAAQPNPDLVEDSEFGPLPTVAPDGLRPMDQYGRPWSGARGTRVAIVVGGIGLSQTGSQRAIQQLPPGVTFAFAASGNSLQRWMQDARRKGHEILLQVPFEPFDYPTNDPGPTTLLTTASSSDNLVRLHQAMAKITNYTGIMNYQGGRYLSDEKALKPVLDDVAQRGLLFLDDGSSALSKTEQLAGGSNLPVAFGDLVLDGQLKTEAILRKLDDLERIAERKGTAIGVAAAFDESVDAIRQWSEEAAQRGVEIVGVSAIVRDNSQP
jgi:polysaccharide deacetylase 2 family uncharacterized protein YibQ